MLRPVKMVPNRASIIPIFPRLAGLILVVVIIAGCGFAGAVSSPPTAPVAPVLPTSTVTSTSAPTVTPTPQPTETSTPTTVPTPAKVGGAVPYGSLEITVIGMATHDLIVPGGLYYYYPKDRTKTFLDLGVLVKNADAGNPVNMLWKDIFITEADGSTASPAFGDMKTVELTAKMDPFKIGISTQRAEAEAIVFEKSTYLRLVFIIAKKQSILFAIKDSPAITFKVN